MLVQRLQESNKQLHKAALDQMRTLIRTETATMTSVPKPLKFLLAHYKTLCSVYESKKLDAESLRLLADVLSILGMSAASTGRDALMYRLLGSKDALGSWGHEYVRYLAAEVIDEFNDVLVGGLGAGKVPKLPSSDVLLDLAREMIPFFIKHHAEADACDLALELELLEDVAKGVDESNLDRVCLYLTSCAEYVPAPDDIKALNLVHRLFKKFGKWPQALITAVKLHDPALVKQDFMDCQDPSTKHQLAYMLARLHINIEDVADEKLTEILSNSQVSKRFLSLAKELEVLEPKTPEDIYKTHLENTRPGLTAANVDSAKQNLASSIVNAFVNVGFGKDKLIIDAEESNNWIYKNKDHGMLSATASIGALLLWDVEMGLTQLDKFLYSSDDNIKAGALLGIGIVNCGVRDESDPAVALLSEHIENPNVTLRTAAIMGLGLAYAGSARQDIVDMLSSTITDIGLTTELSATAAVSAALIHVGTCDGDLSSAILQTLMERDPDSLKESFARFFALALALLFLGKQEAADVTLETLKVIDHPISKQAQVLVTACAYAATGNVLKIQEMLHECNEHMKAEEKEEAEEPAKSLEEKKEETVEVEPDATFQTFATIGIALIAMGEDIGSQMAMRTFNHLMHYGDQVIRRAVPLALALLCPSNPVISVVDTLSKYSHDSDKYVSINSIVALGIVGAGTNNARLAQLMRQLASFYHKEPNHLFCVRIAQGLLHMGKGTVSVNPFCLNRELLNQAGIAGLLTTLISFTDSEKTVLGKHAHHLYYLIPAVYPRFLITVDEQLNPIVVNVRVGQAVDTVGQAGKPKSISGFQTHSTPVLLGYTERAELATEEYLALSPILEGIVILKKNPDYVAEVEDDKKKSKK